MNSILRYYIKRESNNKEKVIIKKFLWPLLWPFEGNSIKHLLGQQLVSNDYSFKLWFHQI